MPNKMLIDASHPEETRVVVVHGNRIEEFDFESQDKKQLKGNIYLARVTRVEPSLQAAFIEYGGNRHGFLAFSEIHPDYYQIPVADRQALLRAEAEEALAESDDDNDGEERQGRNGGGKRRRRSGRNRGQNPEEANAAPRDAEDGDAPSAAEDAPASPADAAHDDLVEAHHDDADHDHAEDDAGQADGAADPEAFRAMEASIGSDNVSEDREQPQADPVEAGEGDTDGPRGEIEEVQEPNGDEGEIESVGAGDALEEVRNRRKPPRRQYKIQEVIKRRQILLVQVVKEERGNKGAALTTYLSLAGRYSVLMPNTARGGGISRKITNIQDRKRLKEVVQDLDVPQGMGVILRTAGESRTKAEIKRDYEYLMRLWETVRTLTLESTAPALVYEEGSLIKRSVRDLYNKDIEEIMVSGEDAYREAKDFMRMLMPSHAKMVQPFRDTVPIFVRHGVEAQLDRMLQPQVTLKSGGYLVINQTEALVAIDVNSGRSTREHSIEETALHTNLEAAEEVARQLRLRDLAGLIVIDFIDMEENRNNRAVEKRLKDHLKNDRARIQLGRISHFGLMEMSRQRIRASVLESTTKPCPHCGGTGHVRSDSSIALLVVRAIEEFLLKDSRSHIVVKTPTATAMYVLNHKRGTLSEFERRFAVTITIEADEMVGAQHHAIFRGAIAEKPLVTVELPAPVYEEEPEDEVFAEDEEIETEAETDEADDAAAAPARPAGAPDQGQHDRKRRKRRRRRGGRDRDAVAGGPGEMAPAGAEGERGHIEDGDEGEDGDADASVDAGEAAALTDDGADRKKRRRGKRGGRRNRGEGEGDITGSDDAGEAPAAMDGVEDVAVIAAAVAPIAPDEPKADIGEDAADDDAPKIRRRATTRRKPVKAATDEATAEAVEPKKPAKRAPRRKTASQPADSPEAIAALPEPEPGLAANADEAEPAPDLSEPANAPLEVASEPLAEKAVEPEPVAAPIRAAEPALAAPKPVDPDRPKKAGWWQRKGFF